MNATDVLALIISPIVAVLVSLAGIWFQMKTLKQQKTDLLHRIEQDAQEARRLEAELRHRIELDLMEFREKYTSKENRILEWAEALEPADDTVDVAQSELGLPYNHIGPIRQPDLFYGRRDLLTQVVDCTRGQIKSMALLGARKAGKTSFLRYVEANFTVERFPHIIPVYLDAQTAITSANNFYALILRETASALYARTKTGMQMPDFPKEVDFHVLKDFMTKASQQKYHFLLLLDELENLTSNPVMFDEKFFGTLRHLIQIGHGQLGWITASFRPVYTPNTTTSPFGNIMSSEYIGPLTPEDARQLVTQPARRSGRRFENDDVEFILKSAGRMPFMLQKISFLLYKAKLDGKQEQIARISASDAFSRDMHNYFNSQMTNLTKSEKQTLVQIAKEKPVEPDTVVTLQTLESYGFIESTAKGYQILGQTFDDYLYNHGKTL